MINYGLIKQYPALQKFTDAQEQIQHLATACKNIVINSSDSLEQAKELAKNAKKIENLIEDKRKEITKPLLDEKKQIDDYAKSVTADLNTAVKELRDKILRYEQEQERIRQEELRKIEAERRAKEEELRKQMLENQTVDEDAVKELQVLKSQQAAIISETPKNSITKVWTFEYVDIGLIPIDYMMPNEPKIKQAIKSGVREIPGLVIFQKELLTLR